jgi:hypothetical protein
MFRANQISKEVRQYDRDLYCIKGETHHVIMRKAFRVRQYEVDGVTLVCFERKDDPVFHLTDNWNVSGNPIDWGIEPIMKMLRYSDPRNSGAFLHEKDALNAKFEASQLRARKNMFEGMAQEVLPVYKKIRSEVNLANANKSDIPLMKKHEARFKRRGDN